jgi:hypothetical protein
MRKLLLVSVLALSLGACSTLSNIVGVVTGASVTPSQAYIAANAFDAIEVTAENYLKLPPCVAGGSALCRSATAVGAIVPAIRIGYAARTTLISSVVSGNDAPISLYSALTAQTGTLQAIISQYNIGASQ